MGVLHNSSCEVEARLHEVRWDGGNKNVILINICINFIVIPVMYLVSRGRAGNAASLLHVWNMV